METGRRLGCGVVRAWPWMGDVVWFVDGGRWGRCVRGWGYMGNGGWTYWTNGGWTYCTDREWRNLKLKQI